MEEIEKLSVKMERYKREAIQRKEYSMKTLGNTAPVPHDMWKRLIPIAMEYDRGNGKIAILYTYLLSFVMGNKENDRHMCAFPSVERIANETGIGRNAIAKLSDVLVACGLIKCVYDYGNNKKTKLYYPMYYSKFTDDEIRVKLDEVYKKGNI